MTTPAEVVAEARGWISTPWSHLHRTKGIGTDCAGLVIGVARDLGLAQPVIAPYARQPSQNSLLRHCAAHMQRASSGPALGRVAVMRFGDEPQHLGIFGDYPLGGLSLIHGYAQSRKVVEHRFDETWAARVVAVFVLPGVVE